MKEKRLERKETEESHETNSGLVKDKIPQEPKDPLAEMTELLKRTQANFENYRKQQEKRIEEIKSLAAKEIILQVIPVLDNFDLALKNSSINPQEFIKGVELIYSQLLEVLENNGVKPILTENQTFDPFYHEALMRVDSEFPVNTILEEWQKGFTLHNKVIRHAKVKISVGKKEVSAKNNLPNHSDNNTKNNPPNNSNNPQNNHQKE